MVGRDTEIDYFSTLFHDHTGVLKLIIVLKIIFHNTIKLATYHLSIRGN